jgi:hypothetical protein
MALLLRCCRDGVEYRRHRARPSTWHRRGAGRFAQRNTATKLPRSRVFGHGNAPPPRIVLERGRSWTPVDVRWHGETALLAPRASLGRLYNLGFAPSVGCEPASAAPRTLSQAWLWRFAARSRSRAAGANPRPRARQDPVAREPALAVGCRAQRRPGQRPGAETKAAGRLSVPGPVEPLRQRCLCALAAVARLAGQCWRRVGGPSRLDPAR